MLQQSYLQVSTCSCMQHATMMLMMMMRLNTVLTRMRAAVCAHYALCHVCMEKGEGGRNCKSAGAAMPLFTRLGTPRIRHAAASATATAMQQHTATAAASSAPRQLVAIRLAITGALCHGRWPRPKPASPSCPGNGHVRTYMCPAQQILRYCLPACLPAYRKWQCTSPLRGDSLDRTRARARAHTQSEAPPPAAAASACPCKQPRPPT